jgi:hypothetical protein
MSISQQTARPAYVVFEIRSEEDRTATFETGKYCAKDVNYAIITPQGSKDRIEREVTSWFENLDAEVQSGRMPGEWVQAYRTKYAAWVEGREIPEFGTSVANWPSISPAQVRMLQEARLRTIEDLAAANESSIASLGMGGRALKQRAVEWLASAKDVGKVAEEMAAMRVKNETLEAQNKSMQAQIDELIARLPAAKSTKPL